MNKFFYIVVSCFAFLSSPVIAQEAFLRLDSVVILTDTLQMSTSYNNFSINQIINKSVAPGQIVKIRSAGLQLFKNSGSFEPSYGEQISNFGILCNGNIVLDVAAAVNGIVHGNGSGFPINFNYFESRYRRVVAKPDDLFNEDLMFVITCSGNTYAANTVTYRLELIYYSYE